jgi:type IV secretory pathway protease TraF
MGGEPTSPLSARLHHPADPSIALYLPSNIPLIKRVAALGGDHVCAIGNRIAINGRIVARRLTHDRLDRPLPSWSGCNCLGGDEVFLLMGEIPDSFDSRYFGPVPATAIIGKLVALWTG